MHQKEVHMRTLFIDLLINLLAALLAGCIVTLLKRLWHSHRRNKHHRVKHSRQQKKKREQEASPHNRKSARSKHPP